MKKKVIFLDFDGVLFDTVAEAYLVAICTYNKKMDFNIDFKTEHYRLFHMLRYLIGPAWNYYYLLRILNDNRFENIENIISLFNKEVISANKKEYLDFENRFFQTRRYFKKYDYEHWIKFNKPYSFLEKIKKQLIENQEFFFIITTKDSETVMNLLSKERIIFNIKRIYDNMAFERFKKKNDIIQMLMKKENIDKAIFIDDSRKHLDGCRTMNNLILLQPNWGYIETQDFTKSEDDIINEITLLMGQ